MKIVTLLIVVLGINLVHEYHISVCDINFNNKRRILEVTQRVFADDLENTLKNEGISVNVLETKDYQVNDDYFKSYVLGKMEVSTSDREHPIQWLGHEVKSDQIVFYYEIGLSEIPKVLQISNKVLMEAYKDQKNVVHWRQEGKNKRSFVLDRKTTFETIHLF
ncbi:MAG: hypothetical protein Tsb004_30570 [Allomuricauda sp.]